MHITFRGILLSMILAVTGTGAMAQEKTLKQQALDEFSDEHYSEAILLMEKAAEQNPSDPEVYYYLGWFNHYRAYDSRPLRGYNHEYSQQIFRYLDKALALNPDYGDARYFYGAECSGNAFIAMQNSDAENLKYYYKLAADKGAYPPWLLEFGRNFLNSCDKDAILFAGGNADFDVCMYLQLHQNVRTDVTIVPIGNIDRPWYVLFLKNGLENCVRKIDINLTTQQIMDMHPFKWDTTRVTLTFPSSYLQQYALADTHTLCWSVEPDLVSERLHAKSQNENPRKRTFLSPQRAILLQIVEDNAGKRPLFFSNFCSPALFGGLELYFQNCGLVSRLTPLITRKTEYEMDYPCMMKLFSPNNLKDYKTLVSLDMPRISPMVASGYLNAFGYLADCYVANGDAAALRQLRKFFQNFLAIGYNREWEEEVLRLMAPDTH